MNAECVGSLLRSVSTMGRSLATNAEPSSGQENYFVSLSKFFLFMFSRRVPERKTDSGCKKMGTCIVDKSVKKYCTGCRLEKCLR